MADVQDDNTALSEAWFVKCYVNGMRSHIKYQLRPLRPRSLTEAYWMAVDIEQANPSKKSYSQPYTGNTKQYQHNTRFSGDKPTETKHLGTIQRPQEAAKCWRCGDHWFQGHKCKQAPAINLLTGEEPASNDTPQEDDTEPEPEPLPEAQPQQVSQFMHISQQAFSDNVSSICIVLTIGGKQAVALIDTSSSSTFMNIHFALQTKCDIIQDDSRAVKVAGGGSGAPFGLALIFLTHHLQLQMRNSPTLSEFWIYLGMILC